MKITAESYLNPFSPGFQHSGQAFHRLELNEKILVLFLTIVAGIATCFAGGVGGLAAFKALVDHYTILKYQPGKSGNEKTTLAIANTAEILSPSDPKEADDALTTFLPFWKTPSKLLGISEEEAKDSSLKLGPAEIGQIEQFKTRMKKLLDPLPPASVPAKLNMLLSPCKADPLKFLFSVEIALNVLEDKSYSLLLIHDILSQLDWPNDSLKEEQLLDRMKEQFLKRCLSLQDKNFDSVIFYEEGSEPITYQCPMIAIDTKSLFGSGDYIKDPRDVSLNLCSSLTFAMSWFKNIFEQGMSTMEGLPNNQPILLQIKWGAYGATGIPASMAIPFLTSFKAIDGIVQLDLSLVGSGNGEGGFEDQHANFLLSLIKSQKHMLSFSANTGKMTDEAHDSFWTEAEEMLQQREKMTIDFHSI